jgi:hypothetical protein
LYEWGKQHWQRTHPGVRWALIGTGGACAAAAAIVVYLHFQS